MAHGLIIGVQPCMWRTHWDCKVMNHGLGSILDGQQSRVECEEPNGQSVGLEHAVVANKEEW